MRILQLCTDAWGGHGGIALYNRDLATALAQRADCSEVVVVPRILPFPPGEVPERVRFLSKAGTGKIAYARSLLELRRTAFDLVVCSHINLLPIACAFTRNPLLLIYGIDAWQPPKRRLTKSLLPRAAPVVSISQVTLDRFLSWSGYAGPTHLLPNAIHRENFGVRAKRPDLIARHSLTGRRVLMTLGRLVGAERYKGFDEVLEILPRLPEDVVYMIAGNGDDRPRLEARSRNLAVSDRVIFTGFVSESEKADYFNLADLYVMPSRGEGFGYVLLEALASGIPVIGSRQDGGREALLGGMLGLLVDPSNPAEIEAAIRESLARPRKREVPAGIDYFSFEQFRARVDKIVDATLVR
jgi:phosphatidyl-myo-inositol dimannoside synthase